MKKIFVSILACCMILVSISIPNSAAESLSNQTVSYYDGTPTYSWYHELQKDTAGQTYTLSSASDLVGFQMLTNGTAKKADGSAYAKDLFTGDTVLLTVDVVMNRGNATEWAKTQIVRSDIADPIVEEQADTDLYLWDPICDGQDNLKSNAFQGTFDGMGHHISGVYSYDTRDNGLFGQVTGTVKNLVLTNSLFFNAGYQRTNKSIHDNTQGCGSVVDRLLAGGRIENVYSDAYVRGGFATGGIVGFTNTSTKEGTYADVTVKNCVFAGILDCTNNRGSTGGIVGVSDGDHTGYTRHIEGCVFAGSILIPTYVGTSNATDSYATMGALGGIIGTMTRVDMQNCINIGLITYQRSTTTPSIGAISGNNGGNNTAENTYWSDAWITSSVAGFTAYKTGIGSSSAVDGMFGKTASTLASLNMGEGWTNASGYPMPTVVYEMLEKTTLEPSPVELVYAQTAAVNSDTNTYSARFIAEVSVADCAKYTEVVWSITEQNDKKTFTGATTKVYGSIYAETVSGYTAVAAGEGKAFSAFAIRNIPAEGTQMFYVQVSLLDAEGNTYPSTTYVIPLTMGVTAPEKTLTENGLRYELTEKNTYALVAYEGSAAAVTVPATVKGVAVSAIGDRAFANNKSLTSVTVSEGVTTLGNEVFSGCTALADVAIPQSVTEIGYSAFAGTAWLAAQSNVAYVICGNGVLIAYNGGAAQVTIPENLNILAVSDAFRGQTQITRLEVAETVRVIGAYAFADCTALTYLKLPQELDWISNSSVAGCTSLATIEN